MSLQKEFMSGWLVLINSFKQTKLAACWWQQVVMKVKAVPAINKEIVANQKKRRQKKNHFIIISLVLFYGTGFSGSWSHTSVFKIQISASAFIKIRHIFI